MSVVIEGRPSGAGRRVGIVCGRFNELITKQLLQGCEQELWRCGVSDDQVQVCWVPGAFEIPLATRRMALSGCFDAIITLGAVIRGSTPHFDYVAGEAAKGIAAIGRNCDVPIIFGLLTTDSIEQAIERAGTKAGNKGRDAAVAALEMVDILERLEEANKP